MPKHAIQYLVEVHAENLWTTQTAAFSGSLPWARLSDVRRKRWIGFAKAMLDDIQQHHDQVLDR